MIAVRVADGDVVVVFRGRDEPNIYAVRRPVDSYELDEGEHR